MHQIEGVWGGWTHCGQRNNVIIPKQYIPFNIHTYASGLQNLGVVSQEKKPFGLFYIKLKDTGKR